MELGRFHPPYREMAKAYLDTRIMGEYKHRGRLAEINRMPDRDGKISGLLHLLHDTNVKAFIHSLDAARLATFMFPEVDVFEAAILHDIGKTGDDTKYHGPLGGAILRRVGLGSLAFASEEHHIGNSKNYKWTKEHLKYRNKMTSIISLADLVASSFVPGKAKYTKDSILKTATEKTMKKIFSDDLLIKFLEEIGFTDYLSLLSAGKHKDNEFFLQMAEKYGIADLI